MSDIIVKFKPQGHKGLIDAIKKLELAQGGAAGATDKFGKSIGRNRKQMSFFQNSLATMRSKLLLVNFAMAMGVKQILQLTQEAVKVQRMEKAFDSLTGAAENSAIGMSKLRSATLGTMNNMDLLKQANNAMILGVTKNTDEMSDMFNMAKRLGDALGVDTARSVESLVTGIGRQSRLMLDNIGIIVKADEAYEDYAAELGKTKDSLTDVEKKQAFMNATLDAARKKVALLPPQTKTAADQFAKFGASMKNLGLEIGTGIAPALGSFAEGISDFIDDLLLSDMEQLVTDLRKVGVASEDLKELTDAITLEGALKNFKSNRETLISDFSSLSNQIGSHLSTATEFIATTEEAYLTMGATVKTESGFVTATFQDILSVDPDKLIAGVGVLTKEMSRMAIVSANMSTANTELEHTLVNSTTLSKEAKEVGFKKLEVDKEALRVNDMTIQNHLREIDSIVLLLGHLMGYNKALDVLNGTTEESNENSSETVEIFKAEIVALNEKAIIEQQQKLVKQELLQIQNAEFDTLEKKEKADKRANALLKQQITLEEKLRAIKDKNIDANLKAANAVGDFAKKGAQLAGANAKQMANIEATMAIINAIGSGLKITNSKMMKSNPIAATIYAAATVAAGLAQAAIIKSEAAKLGASGGGSTPRFAEGGYVGGRPHSQGGTIIEAERGEFVMSRNATESIGLETLNQMNQSGGGGSINVSVTGNVLTQDFVEGELAESIKEAVRRGSDFGLS